MLYNKNDLEGFLYLNIKVIINNELINFNIMGPKYENS